MSVVLDRRKMVLLMGTAFVAACAPKAPGQVESLPEVSPEVLQMYAAVSDNGFDIPAVPQRYLIPENIRSEVDLAITESPGTIVIDPWQRYLYFVLPGNRATRYRVAVGDQGRSFAGQAVAQYDRSWPSWRPTDNMIREFPDMYGPYKDGLEGGLKNPLGARAIYLFQGKVDTYYRIHGTNEVASVGHATSAGCIRMYNQDAIHLAATYRRKAKVLVLTQAQSAQAFGTHVPATTPYSGGSFSDFIRTDPVPTSADTYVEAYPGGFPDSPRE